MKGELPTTSPATMSKTLNLLKGLGEVLALGFAAGLKRCDGNKTSPHPHGICLSCKKIIDPQLGSLPQVRAAAGKKPVPGFPAIAWTFSGSVLNVRRKRNR